MHIQTNTRQHLFFLITSLLTLCTFILTGCGNGSSGSNPQGSGAGTPSVSSSTPVATPTSAPASPTPTKTPKPTVPFTMLRMLDQQHGWALTASSILKTADGGQSWQDVTPSNVTSLPYPVSVFYNPLTAWVNITKNPENGMKAVQLVHTTDGGQTWTTQSATVNTQPLGVIDLKFINSHEGWMEIDEGSGAGQQGAGIVHTTDGGATWKMVSTSISPTGGAGFFPYTGRKTGLSFASSSTGWAGVSTYSSSDAFVYTTHDGGTTWTKQSLPPLKGMGGSTPPVAFGQTIIIPMLEDNGFTFTLSHNGGTSWQPTSHVIPANQTTSIGMNNIYITDPTHAWAINSLGGLYITTNAGQNWSTPLTLHDVSQFSFISNTIGWAYSGPNQHVPTLLKTTDGGQHWSKVSYNIY